MITQLLVTLLLKRNIYWGMETNVIKKNVENGYLTYVVHVYACTIRERV